MHKLNCCFLLFSGTNDRAGYALARAITLHGQRLAIVAMTSQDKILLGRYKKYVISIRTSSELSIATLEHHVAAVRLATGIDRIILLPISEYFNAFLLLHRQAIESSLGCVIPLVPADLYLLLTNKYSATRFFANHGLAVPTELDKVDGANIPFIAKPRENILNGISQYPLFVKSEKDLQHLDSSITLENYFFQEIVIGHSYYILAYVARSGQVFMTSQENIAQQPNGKSIVFATRSDFHLSKTAARTIQAITDSGFQGFVMVEFIVNSEDAYFIELNPRPWGPLNFCIDNRSNIIEAFIGDYGYGDPHRFGKENHNPQSAACYLWLGGIAQSLRQHGRIDHRTLGSSKLALMLLSAVGHDVYLRRDSWRVFFRELAE